MSTVEAVDAVVAAANVVAKLPYWSELDAEALLTTYREKLLGKGNGEITADGLKQLFLALGYDKSLGEPKVEGDADAAEGEAPAEGEEAAAAEGGEGEAAAAEGGEAAAAEGEAASGEAATEGDAAAPTDAPAGSAAAPAEPGTTDNSVKTWEAVCGQKESVDAAWLISTLALYKSGFGDAALRFAVKAADHSGSGALTEAALWRAVTRAASAPLTPTLRNHLRKAWRGAEKYQAPEEEPKAEGEEEAEGEAPAAEGEGEAAAEGEQNAEGGEAAPAEPAAPKAPEEPKVMAESFLSLVAEDEALAAVLAKDVPVPIEEPPAPEEGEEGAEE